jgi:hypothetical protein
MKRFIAILLCFALLHAGNGVIQPQRSEAQGQTVVVGALMVAIAVAAGWIIIRVYKTYETPQMRTLVLQKDHYDGNWQSVVTNRVLVTKDLQTAMAFPAFGDRMTDSLARYRVFEIKDQNFVAQWNPDPKATAQPYLYAYDSVTGKPTMVMDPVACLRPAPLPLAEAKAAR